MADAAGNRLLATLMAAALAAGCAAAGAAGPLAALPAHFQDPPEEFTPDDGQDDGMDELARPDGDRGFDRAAAMRLADEVAAREPKTPEAFRALEARIRAAAARALPSVVAILIERPEGAGSGSGTIISKDGWVLTAGHVGMTPGQKVRILLADGSEVPGRTAGQLLGPGEDVGLVKIDVPGRDFPAAELGESTTLQVGQVILDFGHPLGPEITPWRPPPLRVGRILGRKDNVLAIDAPLSPGDSGGGVFDLDGKLVGVNSVASDRPDLNAAMSIELAKRVMEELKTDVARGAFLAGGADIQKIMSQSPVAAIEGERGAGSLVQQVRRRALLEALAPLADPSAVSVVGVIVDSRDAGYGVFVDAAGHVLAKDSELGGGVRRIDVLLPDGLTVGAKRIASDPALDLAILQTGVGDAEPLRFNAPAPAGEATAIGDAIITVGRGIAPVAAGHRSLVSYSAGGADNASRAYLGVALRAPNAAEAKAIPGGVGQIVTSVQEGSGAAEAGIAVGDALIKVDGFVLESPESAATQLRMHAPGDTATVTIAHAGTARDLKVRLQRPMWMGGPGNMGAALNRRATGFGEVIVHDGIVPAEAVGGPIIDSHGRVIGLNIARADRTKTYALPAAVVHASVDRMLAKIARGELEASRDPGDGLKPVRFDRDATARLHASHARVIGPTNAVHGDDDFTAVDGWADAEDGVVWRLDVPAAGRYEVALDARGMAGGGVDVIFGGEQMSARVPPARSETEYARARVGEVFVSEPGVITVRVHPLGRPHAPVMSLRGMVVQRIDLIRVIEKGFPYLRFRDLERYKREQQREKRRQTPVTPASGK